MLAYSGAVVKGMWVVVYRMQAGIQLVRTHTCEPTDSDLRVGFQHALRRYAESLGGESGAYLLRVVEPAFAEASLHRGGVGTWQSWRDPNLVVSIAKGLVIKAEIWSPEVVEAA